MSRVFGLTGGIASGKSTVSRIFAEEGVPVVDADLVAREVVEPASYGLHQLRLAFGERIIREDGALDRAKLGAIIFLDPTGVARQKVDDILQPLVLARAGELMREHQANGHPVICFDAALLIEKGYHERFRPLVVVSLNEEDQVKRLMARDGFTEAEAKARIAAQMPMVEKRLLANYVIDNEGSLAALKAQALLILSYIRRDYATV